MKKTLSVLLVLAMMLTSVFVMIPVSAADEPEGTAVTTEEEFLAMDPESKYYLDADIELTSTPYNLTQFKGTFDGNSHTITLAGAKACFSEINGATIKNLTVAGEVVLTANTDAAGVAVYGYGTVTNCVNNADISFTLTGTSKYVGKIGGMIAVVNGVTTISNCVNNGDIAISTEADQADHYIGGIVGSTDGGKMSGKKLVINNCQNNGAISSNQTSAYLGGMVGNLQNARLEMDGCTNGGRISVKQGAMSNKNGAYTGLGGMIGGTYQGGGNSGLSVLLTNCTNNAIVECTNVVGEDVSCVYVGGMIGRGLHNSKFRAINCTNNGDLVVPSHDSGWSGTGGMIGTLMTIGYTWSGAYDGLGTGDGETIMENCKNTGDITGKNAGGMWGSVYQMSAMDQVIKLQYCENTGAINGTETAGGLIGQGSDSYTSASDITIKNCKNSGNVTASQKAAGIVATIPYIGIKKVCTIDSCINTGTVTTTGTSADAGVAIAAGIVGFLAATAVDAPTTANGFPTATETPAGISITNCVVMGSIVKSSNDNDRVAITLAANTHASVSGNVYKTDIAPDGGFGTAKSEAECTTAAAAIKTSVASVATLESAIANASGFEEIDYTVESWTAYQEALAAAKEALTTYETSTQDQVDEKANALIAAINGLTLAPIDATALQAKIDEAKALTKSDYTSISYLRVTNALKEAEAAVAQDRQSVVNAALETMTNALERLELAPKKDNTTGGDTTTGGDSTTGGDTTTGGDNTTTGGDSTTKATEAPAATNAAEEEGGCGSAITATAVVLTTVLALGAGVTFKKKED